MKVALNTHKPVSFGECAIRYGHVYLVKDGKYRSARVIADELGKLELNDRLRNIDLRTGMLKTHLGFLSKLSKIFSNFKK